MNFGPVFTDAGALARRRLFEAAAQRPKTAERVLRLIGKLYAWEAEWNQADVGEQRAALRQRHFAEPLPPLHRLTSALQKRVLPKSGLGQACAYLLGHWKPLTTYLRHSRRDRLSKAKAGAADAA